MAREILFRGFHERYNGATTIITDGQEIKGKWIYGYYIKFRESCGEKLSHFIQPLRSDQRLGIMQEVIPSTVGQYTGLTDKNGFKIWEGDTMNVTDWAGRERQASVIGFHNGVCWFGGDGFSDEYIFNTKSREVTGTVWDKEETI